MRVVCVCLCKSFKIFIWASTLTLNLTSPLRTEGVGTGQSNDLLVIETLE